MNDTLTKIPLLTIRFHNDISFVELPSFRGAVISKVPSSLVLFHNHEGDKLRYHYPLIQYKRIGGKAAILCLGDGTEAIGEFFAHADFHLRIGQREENFVISEMTAKQWLLQPWTTDFRYTLRKWLPFNSANYAAYRQLLGLTERVQLLENILTGNMLSMCTGLGKHIESPIDCKILNLLSLQTHTFKGVKMQAMDIEFQTNLYIPDYIGLGKGVSHGFGNVKQVNFKSI